MHFQKITASGGIMGMERNKSLDILKLTMAFMVIGIHCGFLKDINPFLGYLTVNGIFRIAVPTFYVINGYFFFGIKDGDSRKWLKKTGLMYLFWMLIYSIFWIDASEQSFVALSLGILKNVVFGYYHLWYISGLICAAVLVLATRKIDKNVMWGVLAALFAVGVTIQYFGCYHVLQNSLFNAIAAKATSHKNFLFLSFPFFACGYLLNYYDISAIKPKLLLLLLSVGVLSLVAESSLNYMFSGRIDGFDNLFSLSLVCPLLFIVFMNMKILGGGRFLSKLPNAVYFVHVLFVIALQEWLPVGQTIRTGMVILASLAISPLLIMLSKKVKYIV
jgi:surface polysaccharide O-acyltransferase-like enzyme